MREIEIDDVLSTDGLSLQAKRTARNARLTIALLASEECKQILARFAARHAHFFALHQLLATSGTCKLIRAHVDLDVASVGHGAAGGDIVIAKSVLDRSIDVVIFFRSGMEVAAHEDDIRMLLRVCNMTNTILATNVASAELIVAAILSGCLLQEHKAGAPADFAGKRADSLREQ